MGWLIAGFLPGLATSVALGALRLVRLRTVNRRRWGLSSPDRVRICVSASPDVETGQYRRPSTGIGQAKALALVAPSLTRGWRNIDIQSVYFPHELSGHELEADLILLGGPETNELTASALDLLRDSLGVAQDGSVILAGDHRYEGQTGDAAVTVDYGLVVRTGNPYSPGHSMVILSGSHTYGTVAAARFLIESRLARRGGDLVAVVEARVERGHALTPKIVWTAPRGNDRDEQG